MIAAGLSITNGMNANIAALTQSVQNATNSVGQLQTADGALSEVTTLLNRAVTLATEASSAGMSSSQTAALNNEFQTIVSSIDNIGKNTDFNGANVFSSAEVTPYLTDGTAGNDLLGATKVSVGALSAGATGLNLTQGATASNTLSLGTTNLVAGNALNIGGSMYTLQTGQPTAAGQIQLGSTANATLQNIAAAVNGTDGVNPVNANVTAGTVDTTTGALAFSATANGAAGDLLTATSGNVTGTWASAAGMLTGGSAAVSASKTEAMTTNAVAGDTFVVDSKTYTFVSSMPATPAAGNVLIGSGSNAINATLTNLANAMNAPAGGASTATYTPQATADTSHPTTASVVGNTITITTTGTGAASDISGSAITSTGSGAWGTNLADNLTGGTAGAKSSATETMATNASVGDTLTVGGQTYTFVTTAAKAGDVEISGTAGDNTAADIDGTIANLLAAVNDSSNDGSQTGYWATTAANTLVGSSPSVNSIKFTAAANGAGNNTTDGSGVVSTGASATWGKVLSDAVTGGVDAHAASNTLTLGANLIAGSTLTVGSQNYTFVANGTTNLSAGQIALGTGGNATANTLTNIVSALKGTDGVNTANGDLNLAQTSATSTTLTLTAASTGTVGNGYAATGGLIASTSGGGTWSSTGGTLTGGNGTAVTANLSTVASAQAALVAVTSAINSVSETRGTLGAVVNQLTAASNVMNNQVTNLTSAESGISDADIGTTVANMTKYNTLQQTGIAALQQANQASQSILKLLQ